MNHRIVGILVGGVALGLAGCSDSLPASTDPQHPGPPSGAARGPARAGAGNSPSLSAAHDAYLTGDFATMGERIRDVLLDPGLTALARDNALELLDKAYTVTGGSLPSRFRAPAAVQDLQYLCREYVFPGGKSKFQIRFAGSMKDASDLISLTVRHLPDGLVMDKQTNPATFAVRRDPPSKQRGLEEFVIDSPGLDAPPADGVVTVRLTLKDGTVSEGFIIAHGLGSTARPTILSPAPSDSLTDGNPILRWSAPERFGLPAFEHGRTVIHVSRADDYDTAVWVTARDDVAAGEVRLGSSEGIPPTTLTPGTYEVFVSPGEFRSFGPVELARASRVGRMFHVVTRR